jgi:hypothetical protein
VLGGFLALLPAQLGQLAVALGQLLVEVARALGLVELFSHLARFSHCFFEWSPGSAIAAPPLANGAARAAAAIRIRFISLYFQAPVEAQPPLSPRIA